MKKLIPLSFFILAAVKIFAQTFVPGGSVTGPWTAAGSPYIIQGSITCGNLVIQAGVDVRFQNQSGITCYNSIKAHGTAAQPVIFESDDTTGWADMNGNLGGTSGIYISGQPTDTTILDHIIFKDAKGLITNNYAVGIIVNSCPFILTNSEIYHNYISGTSYMIEVYNDEATITNNSIHDNYGRITGGICSSQSHGLIDGNDMYNLSGMEGAAMYIVGLSDPTGAMISHNHIHNCRSEYDGGAIMLNTGLATVFENNISYNFSARAGSGIYDLYSTCKIISNIICNNTDSVYNNCGINDGGGGININNGSGNITAEVRNNIIANNVSYFSGAGVRVCPNGGGSVIIENNTIANNMSHSYFTGGLEIASGNHCSIRNNIIWGNRGLNPFSGTIDSVQVIMGANDTVSFEYNCGEYSYLGGMITNTGTQVNGNAASNVAVYGIDPGFVSVSGGYGDSFDGTIADWNLTSQSICYDSGNTTYLAVAPQPNDVYGAARISGLYIDIGAAEFQDIAGIHEHAVANTSLYPNPASDVVHVKDLSAFTDVLITNSLGQILSNVKYGNGVDVSSFVPGVYFISFVDAGGMKVNAKFLKN